MGYHPGMEDDGVYLTAVKSSLNPALYPHDANFFRIQIQATLFDKWMAAFVHFTGISVAWAELFWQCASIATILFACFTIARRLFKERRAQWAGVAMVGAMLTLPVAGTALNITDQHLHPRNIATALILLAVTRVLAGRRWQAVPLLLPAFLLHPIMAIMGISFCIFLALANTESVHVWVFKWTRMSPSPAAAAFAPLAWVFSSPNPTWRKALDTRAYDHLYQWAWYEWLGAVAPILLFWLLWRVAHKRGEHLLSRFSLAVFAYGVFQLSLAMIVHAAPALVRITAMQPMRFLHLVYIFMALMGGCLIGKYLLKPKVWRWAFYLVLINTGMFVAQRQLFKGSEHLELPGGQSANPWLQAFSWVRQNTPTNAYFALDPYYMAAPGEDYHSFRALGERSQLADALKDTAVVTQVPELGPIWQREMDAQQGWPHFQFADFQRLKAEFGVDWVVLSFPPPRGLPCPWHGGAVSVCQVP